MAVPSNITSCVGEVLMKLLKIAAIVALASLPILLMKRERQATPVAVDTDEIFEHELRVD